MSVRHCACGALTPIQAPLTRFASKLRYPSPIKGEGGVRALPECRVVLLAARGLWTAAILLLSYMLPFGS